MGTRVGPSAADSGRPGDLPNVQFVRDIYAAKRELSLPVISIEFFPPKTPAGEHTLLEKTIPALLHVKPDFCSVTYGAGGSTRDKTLIIVDRIQRAHRLTTMAHLACVNATRQHVGAFLAEAKALGIRNILALRGDPPAGASALTNPENGFEYSYELIDFIRQVGGLCIGTAGFPESHLDCTDGKPVDWGRLKTKIDHGADFVLTQLFFDNADLLPVQGLCGQDAWRDRPDLSGRAAHPEHGADQALHRAVRRTPPRSPGVTLGGARGRYRGRHGVRDRIRDEAV